jgi:hypothetical protein
MSSSAWSMRLADSFPVTQALVGEDFFRAMAREFVRAASAALAGAGAVW